jgi:hypothetical protein
LASGIAPVSSHDIGFTLTAATPGYYHPSQVRAERGAHIAGSAATKAAVVLMGTSAAFATAIETASLIAAIMFAV